MINKKYICNSKDVSLTMDDYFSKLPKEFGSNYYKNSNSVKIDYVYNLGECCCTGLYDPCGNHIWYSASEALPHELFHMASNNMDKMIMGLSFGKISSIDEGLAEYLCLKTFDLTESKFYYYEVMCANMMLKYPETLKCFLTVNHDEFLKQFHKEDTVIKLMDDMEFYTKVNGYLMNMLYMDGVNARFDKDALRDIRIAVNNTVRGLVRLGIENSEVIDFDNYINMMIYLLESRNIEKYFKIFYPEYMDDIKNEVRKLVR